MGHEFSDEAGATGGACYNLVTGRLPMRDNVCWKSDTWFGAARVYDSEIFGIGSGHPEQLTERAGNAPVGLKMGIL